MKNIPNITDPQIQIMLDEVWGRIAIEIGDQLPNFIYEAIEAQLPSVSDDDVVDDLRQRIASSLGPLAYD
jgi:hypothetical protein